MLLWGKDTLKIEGICYRIRGLVIITLKMLVERVICEIAKHKKKAEVFASAFFM